MEQGEQGDQNKELKDLKNPSFTWRTVRGIAGETGLTQKRAKLILAQPGRLMIESEELSGEEERLFGRVDHEACAPPQPDTSRWWKLVTTARYRPCGAAGARHY
jgi:hypothetical protein